MQLASAKALTSLFVSAQKARPHPISIASYISSPDQVSTFTCCSLERGSLRSYLRFDLHSMFEKETELAFIHSVFLYVRVDLQFVTVLHYEVKILLVTVCIVLQSTDLYLVSPFVLRTLYHGPGTRLFVVPKK